MSDLFQLILSMSLSGAALILLLLALKPFFREGFSKAWQYYIWTVVLIRLLLPLTPEFGLTNDLFHTKAVQNTMLPVTVADTSDNTGSASDPAAILPQDTQEQTPAVTEVKDKSSLPDAWEIAGFIWLAGFLLLLAFKLAQYLHFTYSIRSGAEPVADRRILRLYQKTADELGIKKSPQLFFSGCVASPMLIGLVKPAVYLTEKAIRMEDGNLIYVLRHELMHFKRHDLWYKWCCDLTLTIHWFNPAVYLMGKQINSQCEISCDEVLTKDLNQEEKLIYGNMLLNAASDNLRYHYRVLSTTLYEDKKSLKERILSIMTSKRKSKKAIVISVIAAVLLCTAAFLLGAYTAGNTAKAGADTASNEPADVALAGASGTASGTDTANSTDSTDTSSDAAVNSGTLGDNSGAAPGNTDTSADSSAASNGTDTATGSDAVTDTDATANNSETSSDSSEQGTADPSDSSNGSFVYKDDKYGFEITLPASWKGCTTQLEDWQGIALEGDRQGEAVETGPKLIIRHPEWTEDNPRQDIPVMVFTPDQWKKVENEEIAVSAAPIGPRELSSNSDYVFALPARYNFAYETGYEEVEQIIQDNFNK